MLALPSKLIKQNMCKDLVVLDGGWPPRVFGGYRFRRGGNRGLRVCRFRRNKAEDECDDCNRTYRYDSREDVLCAAHDTTTVLNMPACMW